MCLKLRISGHCEPAAFKKLCDFIVIPGLIFLNLVFYLYSPYNINLNGH